MIDHKSTTLEQAEMSIVLKAYSVNIKIHTITRKKYKIKVSPH